MPKFPSEEWARQYVEKLNSSEAYLDSGKKWEGDITFVIQKDEGNPTDSFLYLDLYHGECRKYLYSANPDDVPKSEFRYIGKYSNWIKLIHSEIDPIKGVLTGKFKLEGSMMKIMRFSKAAKDMVNTATMVPFEG